MAFVPSCSLVPSFQKQSPRCTSFTLSLAASPQRVHSRCSTSPWKPVTASASSTSPALVPAPPLPRAPSPRLAIIHYDGSSFGLEYDEPGLPRPLRVLVDPWLTGDLVFGGQPAFFRGVKPLASEIPISAFGDWDVIVLSQDLPDHCHGPTLEKLPRSVPVVCPAKAVPILKDLGYESILSLAPGSVTEPFEKGTILENFSVRGGKGSITGPPWSVPQLAFCFEFGSGDDSAPIRAYLETHGTHDDGFLKELTRSGPLDAFISPVISLKIPLFANYDVIYGAPELIEACKSVKPKTVVPFDNSRTEASGALVAVLQARGGYDEFRKTVKEERGLEDLQVAIPELLKPVVIAERS